MSRLKGIGGAPPLRDPPRRSILPLIALSAMFIILLIFVVGGIGSAYVIIYVTTTTTSTSTTSTSTTSTSTTSTTTTSSTTTTEPTTSTSTTSTSTTTTTLCGTSNQPVCSGSEHCKPGLVENSYGYCIGYDCASTVASGNPGCGSWDLNLQNNWCKPGGKNPASSGLKRGGSLLP